MLCDVVVLREQGKRLRSSELKPPIRGMLSVGDSDLAVSGSFKRQARVAQLYVFTGAANVHNHVLPPLFDPMVLRIDDARITLIGIELSSSRMDDGLRVSEFVQVWRCSPLLDQRAVPPRR